MVNYLVYTDGSYHVEGETHGGIVFWDENAGTYLSRTHVYTKLNKLTSMWNVGGEIIAAYCAIMMTVNKVKELNNETMDNYKLRLVYDYEGIGKWLTEMWKAKKPATQWFVKEVHKLLKEVPNLQLELIWVKGHGACAGNNEADRVSEYTMNYAKNNNIMICLIDEFIEL